jgi:hypothetical protein
MAHLNITVDDVVLRRALRRAAEQYTSIDEIVRSYLIAFAGEESERHGLQEFLRLARASSSRSSEGGRSWTRDELHER